MAAKRTGPAKTKSPGDKPDAKPVRMFQDVIEAQMELWKKWNSKAGVDVSDAAREVAPIVATHWAKIFEALWQSASVARLKDDPLAGQEELRRYVLISYNDMLKKVLTTKAFASRSGKAVKGLLENVKGWNEVMEETLRMLHLPTKTDIDELHEAFYSLSRQVDYLVRTLENGGLRRAIP